MGRYLPSLCALSIAMALGGCEGEPTPDTFLASAKVVVEPPDTTASISAAMAFRPAPNGPGWSAGVPEGSPCSAQQAGRSTVNVPLKEVETSLAVEELRHSNHREPPPSVLFTWPFYVFLVEDETGLILSAAVHARGPAVSSSGGR